MWEVGHVITCVFHRTGGQRLWEMFSAAQWVFVCSTFGNYYYASWKNYQEMFCKKNLMSRVPCKRTIYRVVETVWTTCSVLNKDKLRNADWPPTSPALIPCQYYLWGARQHSFVNCPHIMREPKYDIRKEVASTERKELRHMSRNIFSRYDTY
jgi:hypothetical protein